MVVGNVPEAVDFIVAGGGPGGYVAALRAAQAGRSVLLVDELGGDGVGGVCLHRGCIPSKTLIEASDRIHQLNDADMGISVSAINFTLSQFQQHKKSVIKKLTGGVNTLLKAAAVQTLAGRLSLMDHETVLVNTSDGQVHFYTFESLILATGSSPVELSALPFDSQFVVNSTDLLNMTELPVSLAVVGAGYIGVELGMALAKLGVSVTLIDQQTRILPLMPRSLTKWVEKRMKDLAINFVGGQRVSAFERGMLSLEDADGRGSQVVADRVLVCVGRHPNTQELGLESINVSLDAQGHVPVGLDRKMTDNIAAIGDITQGPALAHKAMAEATVAVDALCGKRVAFDAEIAEIIFCDPEIASVGMTAAVASSHDIDVGTSAFPLAASGRALTMGSHGGTTELVFDKSDGTVLGVHVAGPHASELISQGVMAIELGASVEDLALIVNPHPTLSEMFSEAAHAAIGSPIHQLR